MKHTTVVTAVLLMLVASFTMAYAQNGTVSGDEKSYDTAQGFNYVEPAPAACESRSVRTQTINRWKVYSAADVLKMGVAHFNNSRIIVNTVQRRPGEQVDIVEKGYATSYLYLDNNGVLRKRGCNNRVLWIQAEAKQELRLESKTIVVEGIKGDKGDRGDRGYRGKQGPPGPAAPAQPAPQVTYVTNNWGSPQAFGSAPMGGQYGPVVNSTGIANVGFMPGQQSISICVGGPVIDINNVNQNVNVNDLVNNNTIAIKGQATGAATATGKGTAVAKPSRK